MSPTALALVLVSVCLHAGWNLLGKRQAPSLAFFTLAMGGGGLAFAPLLWLGPSPWSLPSAFWAWLIASGLCQTLYMAGLAWAYARGEISVLYPLARALPVVLVPLVGLGLPGDQSLGALDWLGMVLILVGALCLPMSSWRALSLRTYLTPALGFALLAAVGTVGYSLIDKRALGLMTAAGHSPLTAGGHYMVLQALITPLWAAPLVWWLPAERRTLPELWAKQRRNALLTGLIITATYGLVLMAMTLTAEVSYVVAMRQLSIPLGVFAGVWWLKESAAPVKLAGVAVMLAGLAIVALQ